MKDMTITIPLDRATRLFHKDPINPVFLGALENLSDESKRDLAPLLVEAAKLPNDSQAAWVTTRMLQSNPEWMGVRVFEGSAGEQVPVTALDIALRNKNLILVDTLLELGADAKHGTGKEDALVIASRSSGGNARVMDAITMAILEKGKYSASEKSFALAVAANSGNLGSTKALLRSGAGFSVEISSWDGEASRGTALAVASFIHEEDSQSEKIVEAMLASPKSAKALNAGWDNEDFGSPAHCAAFNGNLNIMARLIAAGAVINPPDSFEGEPIPTPLMSAAFGLQPEMIQALVQAGANVALVDDYGQNALHHLALGDETLGSEAEELPYLKEAFEHLIKAGCSPRVQDDEGKTPIDVARNRGRDLFADFMENPTVEVKASKKSRTRMPA